VPLPEPFPAALLTRPLTVSSVRDLLRTLTSTWLLGDGGRSRREKISPSLEAWRNSLLDTFDQQQLEALRTAQEDYEPIAFLHFFKLILYDEVKKALVATAGAGEKAIDQFTHVRFCALHRGTLTLWVFS
jgi:hypothetical protein